MFVPYEKRTKYEQLYESLLPKFKDYEIPLMEINQVKELLHDYLIPAISKFHVCKQDLSDRDDLLERFNVTLSDVEIEILSNYMLIEYVSANYIVTPTLLKVSLPSVDFHAFSPANHLDKLLEMRNDFLKENEALLSRYAWMNFSKQIGVYGNKLSLSAGYKKNKF